MIYAGVFVHSLAWGTAFCKDVYGSTVLYHRDQCSAHTHTLTQALLHGSWSRVAFGESFFEFDLNKTHFNLSRCLTLCGVAF